MGLELRERRHARERRPPQRHHADHEDRERTARDDRGRDAENVGGEARLRGTELVRHPDEHEVHGGDATANVIRYDELLERQADHHADVVERAAGDEQHDRQRQRPREADAHGRSAEQCDDDQQHAPGAAPGRDPATDDRHRDGPERLRCTQEAVADRTDAEQVARDGGEQGGHAGEQHREHVEGERGQEQRRAEDEAEADAPVAACVVGRRAGARRG